MIGKKSCVKRFCCESVTLIENYEEAVNSDKIYDCHHRNEIEMNKSRDELIDLGLYWNRPASELIFLEHGEHSRLHILHNHSWFGKTMSDEQKQKISMSKKGCAAWNKGKAMSDEQKQKMSELHKGRHWYVGEDGKRHWI